MNLNFFLEQEHEQIILFLKNFSDENITKENIHEAFLRIFQKKGCSILASLTKEEFSLFYLCYVKEFITFTKKTPLLENVLQSLTQKGLIRVSSSVSSASFSYKVTIFSEILQYIKSQEPFLMEKDFFYNVKQMNTYVSKECLENIPQDVYQFFYSYGFVCPEENVRQNFQESLVEYLLKEGIIRKVILISNTEEKDADLGVIKKPWFCYQLISSSKLVTNDKCESVSKHSSTYQGGLFNAFSQIAFFIMKEGLVINQNNQIHKRNLDQLLKIVDNEYIVLFIVNFLLEGDFFEEPVFKNSKLERKKLSHQVFSLLHCDLESVYMKLLQSQNFLFKIYNLVIKYKEKPFSLADITFIFFKENFKQEFGYFSDRTTRRNIFKSLENLYFFGIITKHFTEENHLFYTVNKTFLDLIYKRPSETKQNIKLMSTYELVLYDNEVSLQDIYTVSMFSDLKSISTAKIFHINMQSIHRGLYFGFDLKNFTDFIQNNMTEEIPAGMLKTINYWKENFKTGKITQSYVLKTHKTVLDHLQMQAEYKDFIIERISDEHAVVSIELVSKGILQESGFYFLIR